MSAHDFIGILKSRGFVHQISDEAGLKNDLSRKMITAYIGFDCTAASLHVGNLMGIMMLRWLQKSGHRPIVLLGGGTTKIGDPSGKEENRQLLTLRRIEQNKTSIKKIFSRFLNFEDGENKAIMLDNDAWLSKINYIDLLRDYGRHFSVNRMLTMDSVRLRLEREQSLSFLEFNYMILQSYDFVELHRNYDCVLQMGGSDQWGNIVAGIELGRRVSRAQLYALTCPLMTSYSGAKMGKTAEGAIWLDEEALSVHDYWQFWRNTQDADVGRFLRIYTELEEAEIRRLVGLSGEQINEAKIILANCATQLAHGKEAAQKAAKTAHTTFVKGKLSPDLPTYYLEDSHLKEGIGLLDTLVRIGFCKSNGEGRRYIKNSAVRINDQLVEDSSFLLQKKHLSDDNIKLSLGKKKHCRLTLTTKNVN